MSINGMFWYRIEFRAFDETGKIFRAVEMIEGNDIGEAISNLLHKYGQYSIGDIYSVKRV